MRHFRDLVPQATQGEAVQAAALLLASAFSPGTFDDPDFEPVDRVTASIRVLWLLMDTFGHQSIRQWADTFNHDKMCTDEPLIDRIEQMQERRRKGS